MPWPLHDEHWYPNVYLETGPTFRTPGVIETLVEQAGAERVLFGSNTPLMDPRCQMGKNYYRHDPGRSQAAGVGEDARRLLRLLLKSEM